MRHAEAGRGNCAQAARNRDVFSRDDSGLRLLTYSEELSSSPVCEATAVSMLSQGYFDDLSHDARDDYNPGDRRTAHASGPVRYDIQFRPSVP